MKRLPLGLAATTLAAALLWAVAGDGADRIGGWPDATAPPASAAARPAVSSRLDATAATFPDALPRRAAKRQPDASGSAARLETEVLRAYGLARGGHGTEAAGVLAEVLNAAPAFRPALMLDGLLAAEWTQSVPDAEDDPASVPHVPPPAALSEESLLRFSAVLHRPARRRLLPANLLQVGAAVRVVLAADLSESRLYVFDHDARGLWLRSDHYLSTGARGSYKQTPGDQRTPIGVYSLLAALPASQLPALAGHGAWPLGFPNRWDQWQGHLGSGIWIHGSAANQFDGLPHSTNGCLALSNADLDLLAPDLAAPGTVVLVADHLEWVSPAAIAQRRSQAVQRLLARGGAPRRPVEQDSLYAYPGDPGLLLVRRGEGSARLQDEFWPAGALEPLPAARS